jgi:hypothetical protein
MKDDKVFTNIGDNISIEDNYKNGWIKSSIKNPNDFILLRTTDKKDGESLYNGLSLVQAEFIANSLQQVINYIKTNTPQVNDNVKIINHKRFEGLEGFITDIDICDNKRPIAVKVVDAEISGTIYVNYDEIEKLIK